jgi:hypothetical protein
MTLAVAGPCARSRFIACVRNARLFETQVEMEPLLVFWCRALSGRYLSGCSRRSMTTADARAGVYRWPLPHIWLAAAVV